MEQLINDYLYELIFAAAVAILVLTILIINISNSVRIGKLKKRYDTFMKDVEKENLDFLIQKCISETEEVKSRYRDTDLKINNLERNLMQSVQKVGLVRFNAFDNVGNDMSFCMALLDSYDNGVVLSGLFSRDNCINYAKPVVKGKSKIALSAEEMQAIEVAKKNSMEIMYNTQTMNN